MGLQRTSADPWTSLLRRGVRRPGGSRRPHSHLLPWTEQNTRMDQEHGGVPAALTGSEQNPTACPTIRFMLKESRAYPEPSEVIIKVDTAKTEFFIYLPAFVMFSFTGVKQS